MPVLHCFDWWRFVVSVEIGKCKSSFFFEIVLVVLVPCIFTHCINTGLGGKFFRKERRKTDIAEGSMKSTLCFLSDTTVYFFSLLIS